MKLTMLRLRHSAVEYRCQSLTNHRTVEVHVQASTLNSPNEGVKYCTNVARAGIRNLSGNKTLQEIYSLLLELGMRGDFTPRGQVRPGTQVDATSSNSRVASQRVDTSYGAMIIYQLQRWIALDWPVRRRLKQDVGKNDAGSGSCARSFSCHNFIIGARSVRVILHDR